MFEKVKKWFNRFTDRFAVLRTYEEPLSIYRELDGYNHMDLSFGNPTFIKPLPSYDIRIHLNFVSNKNSIRLFFDEYYINDEDVIKGHSKEGFFEITDKTTYEEFENNVKELCFQFHKLTPTL